MGKLSKKEEIQILKEIRDEIIEYVDNIDDRNSLKIQYMKSDMQKILKKRKTRGKYNENN